MKILITGSTGQLGQTFKYNVPEGIELIRTTKNNFNLLDNEQCFKKILEINNDFEEKKNKLNSDIEKNEELISNELPKLCVNFSDNLYEKIMGEKNKGSVSDFKKIIGDDKQ